MLHSGSIATTPNLPWIQTHLPSKPRTTITSHPIPPLPSCSHAHYDSDTSTSTSISSFTNKWIDCIDSVHPYHDHIHPSSPLRTPHPTFYIYLTHHCSNRCGTRCPKAILCILLMFHFPAFGIDGGSSVQYPTQRYLRHTSLYYAVSLPCVVSLIASVHHVIHVPIHRITTEVKNKETYNRAHLYRHIYTHPYINGAQKTYMSRLKRFSLIVGLCVTDLLFNDVLLLFDRNPTSVSLWLGSPNEEGTKNTHTYKTCGENRRHNAYYLLVQMTEKIYFCMYMKNFI